MKKIVIFLLLLLLSLCDLTAFWDSDQNIKIDSVASLKAFMKDGMEHGYFPSQILSSTLQKPEKLHDIDVEFRTIIDWQSNSTCPQHQDQIILALAGQNQSVQCGFGDTVILLGTGDDWVEDSWGNDIIYPGTGNDTINAGHDNDIIIFDENWGHDTLTLHSKRIQKNSLVGYDGEYPWQYSSFIIFSRGISRDDIVWKDGSLVHLVTGDSIKLNTKQVNILFASDDIPQRADLSFIPEYQEPEVVQLEELSAEAVFVKDTTAYYAKGNDGLYVVDLTRLAAPTVLSKLVLPGRAMSVNVVDDLAFVAQADSGLEGKKGWVSIIDISDSRSPKILNTIRFGMSAYGVAVAGDFLYVPETHFQSEKAKLHIFDISKPKKPKLVSTTILKGNSRYIAYLDETLFLSKGLRGIQVFDVGNPKKPMQTAQYGLGKQRVRAIKVHDGKIVVNGDNGNLTVLHPTKDKKLQTLCKVTTQEEVSSQITPGVDSILIRDNMVFRAEGQNGVTVTDITDSRNCHLVSEIPIEEQWVGSVYIVKNSLIAFNDHKRSTVYNLDKLYPEDSVEEPSPLVVEKSSVAVIADNGAILQKTLSQEQLQTLLYDAASDDDAEHVKQLCVDGARPNENGHNRHNPIEISAMLGNLDSLRTLLECPGVPTAKSMMRAALNEEMGAMKILEQYGGNIAQTDSDGCTTLHYIAQDGTLEMVKYLVDQGVPVDAECRSGETALEWAHFDENQEVIDYLENL